MHYAPKKGLKAPSDYPQMRGKHQIYSCIPLSPNAHEPFISHALSFLPFESSTLRSQSVLHKKIPSIIPTNPNAIATPAHKPSSFHPKPKAVPILIGIATA